MPKHQAKKFLVNERNDIHVGRLVHYAAAMAEDVNTMGPVAQRHIGKTQTKHRRAEQLYGRHLVRLGAAMAERK